MSHIGTLNEQSLHAALKAHLARPGDRFEVPLDGSVIDIVRGAQLIEIQTRHFGAMKRKLKKLLPQHPVHLVHPIPVAKWIIKEDAAGQPLSRRKSPKQQGVENIFDELVYIPHLMSHPNFSLQVILIHEEERRRFDARKKRSWRRKGWVSQGRALLEVVAEHHFQEINDLVTTFIPAAERLERPFTTAQLAKSSGYKRPVAQRIAYCLHAMGGLERVGKKGNAYLYQDAK